MAADSARNKAVAKDSSGNSGGATSIAAVAAAAAASKKLSPKKGTEGSGTVNIAAMAAAAAQKKSAPKNDIESGGTMNIAAIAAAAARKKEAQSSAPSTPPNKNRSQTEGKGSVANIADVAAAAARKKNGKSSDVPVSQLIRKNSQIEVPANIAAVAAAAAKKKSVQTKGNLIPASAPKPPLFPRNSTLKERGSSTFDFSEEKARKPDSKKVLEQSNEKSFMSENRCRSNCRSKLEVTEKLILMQDWKQGNVAAKVIKNEDPQRKPLNQIHKQYVPFHSLNQPQCQRHRKSNSLAAGWKNAINSLRSSSNKVMDINGEINYDLRESSLNKKLWANSFSEKENIFQLEPEDDDSFQSQYDEAEEGTTWNIFNNSSQGAKTVLLSLRSSAVPSRSLDSLREQRRRCVYGWPPSQSKTEDGLHTISSGTDMSDMFETLSTASFSSSSSTRSMDRTRDALHAKAAKALIRVVEMKDLDFDHVVTKLETLSNRKIRGSGRPSLSRESSTLSCNLNDSFSVDNYQDNDDNISITSERSTRSSHCRRATSNAQKLAAHILLSPQDSFTKKRTVPLKDDPEFTLYFRMLRYGFTMGAVRAALARDGKPDITRLNPEKPINMQKPPRFTWLEDEACSEDESPSGSIGSSQELAKKTTIGPGSFVRRGSIKLEGGIEVSRDGLTDKGWETALESAVQSSTGSDKKDLKKSLLERRNTTGTIPRWLQPQAEKGIMEGWLRKKTRRGRFVRRWFTLDCAGVYYSHAPPSASPKSQSAKGNKGNNSSKFTKIADSRNLTLKPSPTNPVEFELLQSEKSNAIVTLRAQSNAELKQWSDAVASARDRQRLMDEMVLDSVFSVSNVQTKVEEFEQKNAASRQKSASSPQNSVHRSVSSAEKVPVPGDPNWQPRKFPNQKSLAPGDPSWQPRKKYSQQSRLGDSDLDAIPSFDDNEEEVVNEADIMGDAGTGELGGVSLDGSDKLSSESEGDRLLGGDLPDRMDQLSSKSEEDSGTIPLRRATSVAASQSAATLPKVGVVSLRRSTQQYDKFIAETSLEIPTVSDKPRRPKLERQNSWPPVSLISPESLAAQKVPKKTREEVERDLKKFAIEKDSSEKPGASEKSKEETSDSKKDGSDPKDKPDEKAEEVNDTDGEPKLKNDPKYIKYFKMMKMGLPKEAAAHAMTRDQLDPAILDLDPEKSLKSQLKAKEEAVNGPPLKDDPKYSKYFKMMKMGLPKEAAAHAMTRDQLDPSILDLDPEKPLKSQLQAKEEAENGPPLKDDPKYSKYFKMMKMGLPKEAAAHAMTRDQLDPSILDLDPEKPLKTQVKPQEEKEGPPLKDDPKYSKYFKMIKMGLPKEAAAHAMTRDQLDPAILDLDPEKSLSSQLKAKQETPDPPLKEDPKFSKYFKMLKMGLPEGAVKNALQRDGHDPGILDLDHSKPLSAQLDPTKKISKPKKVGPKIRRKKVYWNSMEEAKEGTIWALLKNFKNLKELLQDTSEFEQLFTQVIDPNNDNKKKQGAASSPTSKSAKTVKVIDGKRGMNGDIILKKVKLDPAEVAAMVDRMDYGKLDAAEIKSLYEFFPNEEEINGLTSYMESAKSQEKALKELTPCEQYMVALKDLKDGSKKFESMIFSVEFRTKMKELKWDIECLSAACDELKSSQKFKALLATVLMVVNEINSGGDESKMAAAFSLDTLLKLNETKAFDNKTTVLHYLVKVLNQTNKDVLKFQEDIKSVVLAKNVVMERLLSVVKQLCEEVKVVKETAKKDGERLRETFRKSRKKNDHNPWKDQRSSLHELCQLKVFLSESDITTEVAGDIDWTHFERFALFSKLELERALDIINDVNEQYLGVLNYFGEDSKMQCCDFFGMLDQFMEAFDATVDQVEKEEAEKLKEARRQLAKEAKMKVKSAMKSAAAALTISSVIKETNEECEAIAIANKKLIAGKRHTLLSDRRNNRGQESEETSKQSGIAALAAQAAKSRTQSSKKLPMLNDGTSTSDEAVNGGTHLSVAAMAAAAAKKKIQPSPNDGEESSEQKNNGPMNIAAMAASAARKQVPKKKNKIANESSEGAPMNIASMAALAAQKRVGDEKGNGESQVAIGGRMNNAAVAAAAAQKKSSLKKTTSLNESNAEAKPMNIAAMAASAAKKKIPAHEMGKQSASPDSQSRGPLNIAALAAAAAKKKTTGQKPGPAESSDVERHDSCQGRSGPMSIAAMAATAAQKKSFAENSSPGNSNDSRLVSIADIAASAARKKMPVENGSKVTPKKPMSIADMAALAAQKKSSKDSSASLNIADMAAAAALKKKSTSASPIKSAPKFQQNFITPEKTDISAAMAAAQSAMAKQTIRQQAQSHLITP